MNPAHLHLLVNHIPILGGIFAVLLLAWGWLRRDASILRLSLALFVILAAAAIAVHSTGDAAADTAERLPDVTRELIDAHESAAGKATTVFFVAGLVALAGLIAYRKRPVPPAWFLALLPLVGAATAVMVARAGMLGGEIRHTETRP